MQTTPTFQNPNTPAIVALRIRAALATGMAFPAAFDSVFGDGAYVALAGEIWEHFNAQKEA